MNPEVTTPLGWRATTVRSATPKKTNLRTTLVRYLDGPLAGRTARFETKELKPR